MPPPAETSIAENLARVQDSIAAACRSADRSPEEVELVAVSKTHPVEYLLEAARAGQTVFGENRVQELSGKAAALRTAGFAIELGSSKPDAEIPSPSAVAAPALKIHLIGHLQSNKASRAAELFTSIDTVDSLKLAERLNEAAAHLARTLPVLLEIKLSPEPSKEGLAPGSDELERLLERLPDLSHLALRGIMTIAPIAEDPAVARTCFCQLRELRELLAQRHPALSFAVLSMGMSGDYIAAIEEGSTQVRLGTAIFGARPKPA